MSHAEILVLNGVTVADVARALRRSGLAISDGGLPGLYAIAKLAPRTDNVVDLAMPAFLRKQAGPISDIEGVDYGIPEEPA